jgi:RNA polymerase sigma factor (TIGR02999 family)
MKPAAEVTVILGDLRAGRAGAAERLSALVYDELRAMAGAMMSQERAAHTLQPTALVHEAFVRMSGSNGLDANDRKHFMAIAAKVMRQVLIDHARAKRADKRGGGKVLAGVEGLDSTVTPGTSGGTRELDVLDLDDALQALAEEYPRAARVAAARYLCLCWMRRSIRTPRRRWCGRRLRDLGFRGRDPERTAPRTSPSRCRKRSVGIGCCASLAGAGWGWCTSVSRLSPSGKSR